MELDEEIENSNVEEYEEDTNAESYESEVESEVESDLDELAENEEEENSNQ